MKKLALYIVFILLVWSCKNPPDIPPLEEKGTEGILILNEGLWNQNNASLTWYDALDNTTKHGVFQAKNNRKLGDVANDMILAGNRIYIVVNNSHTLEVMTADSLKSIKQISLLNNTVGRGPRHITIHEANVYVSCFDGTVAVIDTTTLTVQKYIQVGKNPEELQVSNQKLYVANSGGLDAPNYDSTLSIVDITTLEETKKVTIGPNLSKVIPYNDSLLFIISRGDYDEIDPELYLFNTLGDSIAHQFQIPVSSVAIVGDSLYYYYHNYSTSKSTLGTINLQNYQVSNQDINEDQVSLVTAYGITVDEIMQKIYINDAKYFSGTGEVHVFALDGTYIKSIETENIPNKIILQQSF